MDTQVPEPFPSCGAASIQKYVVTARDDDRHHPDRIEHQREVVFRPRPEGNSFTRDLRFWEN
jgi:hypothetical protein